MAECQAFPGQSLLAYGLLPIKVSFDSPEILNKHSGGNIMTLLRYNRPNRDVVSRNFSDIMDEFFNDVVTQRRDNFVPGIDISETGDKFLVSVELPGMNKEDIDVSLDNGQLTISGERKFEKEEDGKTYHRVETRYGSFSRSFQLPDNVDEESINAKYENGLLNITINKTEDKVKKQIEVN